MESQELDSESPIPCYACKRIPCCCSYYRRGLLGIYCEEKNQWEVLKDGRHWGYCEDRDQVVVVIQSIKKE